MLVLPISEIDNFCSSQRSGNTKRAYRQDLDAFYAWMGEYPVTEERVIEWRDYIENQLSNGSALRRFTTARTFFKWMGMQGSPFERVKPPRRITGWTPEIPSEADIDSIVRVCTNDRDRVIIALLNNGLRAQEVCDLRKEDVYFDTAYQTTILRVTGKGMKQRLVPANGQTIRALQAYGRVQGDYIFSHLNIRKVYYVIKKWAEVAEVEGIHPHALRHGYATRLVRSKVSVFSLQRLLGHQRAETTSIYVNLDLSDLIAATQADPRNEG